MFDTVDLLEAVEMDPELGEALKLDHPLVLSIRERASQFGISKKQVDLVKEVAARVGQKAADEAWLDKVYPKIGVPEGKTDCVGKVVSIKLKESEEWGDSLKMTVMCLTDGGRYYVWGSVTKAFNPTWVRVSKANRKDYPPAYWAQVKDQDQEQSILVSDLQVGDSVGFTAQLSRSDRDPSFGFFKRPAKARIEPTMLFGREA